jgi:hypothetical protein
MSPEHSSPEERAPSAASLRNVSLSRWVNERFPAWEHLLTAHDVARLTRRPPWILTALVLIGRFPRKCRYHGRGVGWLRSDVLVWMSRDQTLDPVSELKRSIRHCSESTLQPPRLPFECASSCKMTPANNTQRTFDIGKRRLP